MIPLLTGQQSRGVAEGPVPPPIAAAEKVSIANARGQNSESIVDQTASDGVPNRPYYPIRNINVQMRRWTVRLSDRPA